MRINQLLFKYVKKSRLCLNCFNQNEITFRGEIKLLSMGCKSSKNIKEETQTEKTQEKV